MYGVVVSKIQTHLSSNDSTSLRLYSIAVEFYNGPVSKGPRFLLISLPPYRYLIIGPMLPTIGPARMQRGEE